MRTFFVVFLFLTANISSAQDILGVKFGQNYNTVKSILTREYGTKVKDDRDEGYNKYLSIENITFGGVKFDKVGFSFKYANKTSYFDFVLFQTRYGNNSYDCADADMDKLLNFVEKTYGALRYPKDNDNIRYVEFGEDPKYKYLPIGRVRIQETTALDGKTSYHLALEFGVLYE